MAVYAYGNLYRTGLNTNLILNYKKQNVNMFINPEVPQEKNKGRFKIIFLFTVINLFAISAAFSQAWETIGNNNVPASSYIGTAFTNNTRYVNPMLVRVNGTLMASFGISNNISFQNSTAGGVNGGYTVAMGNLTTASGYAATALGSLTNATGGQSTAMGSQTTASNFAAVAIGNQTTASGWSSLAIGSQSKSIGDLSIAAGDVCTANGWGSFAMGENSVAGGTMSTAIGYGPVANGNMSTAMGNLTTANGNMSTAFGGGTIAASLYEVAIGAYNTTYTPAGGTTGFNATDRIFSIGNGTATLRSNAFTVLKNGKTGLGTTTPTEVLDVVGNVKFSGALMPNNVAGTAGQVLTSAGPGAPPTWTAATTSFSGTTNYISKFTPTGTTIGNSEIYDNGTFVGIGTTTGAPGYLFAVNGKGIFTDIMVESYGNWPDFVFDNNYKLIPIAEVERYINKHKHLPGVASADDIEKNGIDIGVNQSVLLQKIEELTLYIIDQNKKIEIQNKESEEQDKKIAKLQNQQDQIQELKKEVEDLKMLLEKK